MMKIKKTPSICIHCKWYENQECMFDDELRTRFIPDLFCFEPVNNPDYPDPRKVFKQGFSICSKEFSYFESEFGRQREAYDNGQEFLQVLDDFIDTLKMFKEDYLILQKAFNKLPKTLQ